MNSPASNTAQYDRFLNRELSFLEFNRRVLLLAYDARLPLLERLQYLCICSSNLDEFFEVRVAGLQQQAKGRIARPAPDGLTPVQQLEKIAVKVKYQVRHQYRLLNNQLMPALRDEGIHFVSPGSAMAFT